jgi:hypothetical protein
MGALVAVNRFPNCFEKAKAGGHFLFFGQTCRMLIKRMNVALAHNYVIAAVKKLNPIK